MGMLNRARAWALAQPTAYAPAPAAREPMVRQQDYTLSTSGPALQSSLGFLARGVLVDNPTSAWLYLQTPNKYVPPRTMGVSYPLVPGTQVAAASFQAPPGTAQTTPVQSQQATVTFTNEAIATVSGVSAGATVTPARAVVGSGGNAGTTTIDLHVNVDAGAVAVGVIFFALSGSSCTLTNLLVEHDYGTALLAPHGTTYYNAAPQEPGYTIVPIEEFGGGSIHVVATLSTTAAGFLQVVEHMAPDTRPG